MKRSASILTALVVSVALISGVSFAAGGTPKPRPHKKVIIKKGAHKGVVIKKGPHKGVVIKKGPRKVIIVKGKRKRLYHPKKKVVIVGKPFTYRPWKWRGRIRVIRAGAPLRAHPHPGSAIIEQTPKDKIFKVLAKNEDFYLVTWKSKTWYGGEKVHRAWIHADAVDVLEEMEVKAEEGEELEVVEEEVEEEIEVEDAEEGEEIEIDIEIEEETEIKDKKEKD